MIIIVVLQSLVDIYIIKKRYQRVMMVVEWDILEVEGRTIKTLLAIAKIPCKYVTKHKESIA